VNISQLDLTAAIATYGAVVATLSLAASIWLGLAELNRHKPRLKVIPNTGVLVDGMDRNSEPLVLVEAINTGSGKLRITGVGFTLTKGRKQQFMRPYLLTVPFDVEERRKATLYYACRWLRDKEDTAEITGAFFQDETGKVWKCRLRKKTLRRWAAKTSKGWLIQWDPQLHAFFRQDTIGGPRIPLTG
jgi:hypothetical protein